MAMNQAVLSSAILKSLQDDLKKQYPDAQKMPQQVVFCAAIASGVVNGVKSGKGQGTSGPPAAGKGNGIKSLSVSRMTGTAMSEMEKANGTTGSAQKVFFTAIFTAIVDHLSTQVSLVSPFGGPITSYSGITQDGIYNNIKKLLPDSYISSASGKSLFMAIAKAVADDITKSGKGVVPVGGGTPGPVLASLS